MPDAALFAIQQFQSTEEHSGAVSAAEKHPLVSSFLDLPTGASTS